MIMSYWETLFGSQDINKDFFNQLVYIMIPAISASTGVR